MKNRKDFIKMKTLQTMVNKSIREARETTVSIPEELFLKKFVVITVQNDELGVGKVVDVAYNRSHISTTSIENSVPPVFTFIIDKEMMLKLLQDNINALHWK